MRQSSWLAGVAALGLAGAVAGSFASGLASAQDRPASILPPGFDDPAPTPSPTSTQSAPSPAPSRPSGPGAPPTISQPVIQEIPSGGSSSQRSLPPAPNISNEELSRLPTLQELEGLSPDELDERLGLKPKFDIPPGARRSLSEVGLLSPQEGGLPTASLARQPADLVRAILAGTKQRMVSRWGHIMLRRALASRMNAPEGMDPAEFAALRAGVLNRIGEFTIARSLVQDIDTANWNDALTGEALTAYLGTSDITGACPAIRLQGSRREDPQWVMWQAICNAYAGEGTLAGSQLDRALARGIAEPIDVLLAQRFAGAAGRGRRAVTIEWDNIEELNPWRYALANAVGEPVPSGLLDGTLSGADGSYYADAGANAPMLPLAERETMSLRAARSGIFSSNAMVDLYSQIYADNSIEGAARDRAVFLRDAYVGDNPQARIDAMRQIWGEDRDYAGMVSTAYAAARIPASEDYAPAAGNLIASMLSAGLDRDAALWRGTMADGSLGWALLAVGLPEASRTDTGDVDTYVGNDDSADRRSAAFLVAGLAGLDRISESARDSFGDDLGIDFSRQSRWTRTIDRAAQVENAALVAMLVGLGMQGDDWSRMTPLHLYHIVSALRRVGMEAEARMIAAEAVARA